MAAKGTIGGKIVLEGEKSYRDALKGIKTEQAELRSEMKLCQSTFQDNQNSLEALQQKYEILTRQIDSQTQKVEVYKTAIENYSGRQEEAAKKAAELQTAIAKAEQEMGKMSDSSEDSSEAMEQQARHIEELKKQLSDAEKNYDSAGQKIASYQTNLNNAQADLVSMERELEKTGQYMKEAEDSTDGCAKSIDELGKEVQESSEEAVNFGDVMKANLAGNLIADGIKGLGELFKSLTQETIEAAQAAAAYADEIGTLSVQTGVATDTLQALTYAEELMDVSVSTVTSSMARNIRSMNSAKEGTEEYADAYKKLGITVTDVMTGELRDSETVFWEVVDALGKIENATERDAVAMQLFGRSAQQLNTLVDQGSEGFAKFKQEAYDAGYILEEDAFNALLDTSDAMERVSKKTDALKRNIGAELAPQITRLSETAGNAIEKMDDELVDLASGGIEALTTGIEWLVDNSELVIAGITGITAATVYHSAVAPLIGTVTAAWEAYKVKTEGATVAQWLLNAAQNASPTGLLITGIVGLTAALTTYAVVMGDACGAVDETTVRTKELVKQSKELTEEHAKSAVERDANRKSMEAEATSCKNLVADLKELQSKTKLTSDEQAKQSMIVEQLNQAMPELNLAIDEQTGKINMSIEALEDNVEAMMALGRAEAARKDLDEITEEHWEAEKKLTELREQMKEQQERINEAQEKYNESLERTNELYGAGMADDTSGMAEYEALMRAKAAQEELQQQIDATQSSMEGLETKYANTMDYISDTEAIAEAASATNELGNSAAAAGGQMVTMSADMRQALTDMQADLTKSLDASLSIFDEFKQQAEVSKEELLTNMQSQIEGMQNWADNLTELADKGISQGLLKKLADMGPESAGYVQAFLEMTDEELQKANDLYAESLVIPSDVSEQIMTAYQEAGGNAIEGFTKGITENAESVAESTAKMGTDALLSLNETLKIKSPSKETEESGKNFDDGFVTGVSGNKGEVVDTVKELGADVVTTFNDELQQKKFYDIGTNVTEGIKEGILAGKENLLEEVRKMCTEIVRTTNAELEINSPSKKAEWSGEMYGEGMKGGIISSMADINSVVADSLPDSSVLAAAGVVSAQVAEGVGIYEKMSRMVELIEGYLPELVALAKKEIVLNNGMLVGELAPEYDRELGSRAVQKERYN